LEHIIKTVCRRTSQWVNPDLKRSFRNIGN
jgi:hypothetical protein